MRIICLYHSDLFRISEIIKEEFKVVEFDIKSTDIEIAKFGYRSWHHLIRIKEHGTKECECPDFHNFLAEIQLRTIIMHIWAAIEYEISFKKDIPIFDRMIRRFSIISALLEMIDEQFDQLREEQNQIVDSFRYQPRIRFKKLDLIFKNFQKILDAYFP